MEMELVSLESFIARFNTEEACADYLFQIKWPNGFVWRIGKFKYAKTLNLLVRISATKAITCVILHLNYVE